MQVRGLSKAFGGAPVVDDLSFDVAPNAITALIGPNGAGKTTVLDLCSGFLEPGHGSVLYCERELTRLPAWRIAELGVARSFQQLRLARQLSALDNVRLALARRADEGVGRAFVPGEHRRWELRSKECAKQRLEEVGIATAHAVPAGQLSYGQQKLLTLACCLATGAPLVMLDEPVAGVSPALTEQIRELVLGLPGSGRTVLLIEHNLPFVKAVADHVIVMDQGRAIAEGSWQYVTSQVAVLDAYLA